MVARSGMIEGMAALFGLLPSSVDTLDRALAKAGLRTRTAGGRAPEKMLAIDIVNLAFALKNLWSIRDTPIKVGEITALPLVRVVAERSVRGPHDYPVWVPANKISAAEFEKGSVVTALRYPVKKLPLENTFGGSLANVIEHVFDLEDVDQIRAEVHQEPLRAHIWFRIAGGSERFDVAFGPEDMVADFDQSYSMFGFPEPFLKKMAMVLRS